MKGVFFVFCSGHLTVHPLNINVKSQRRQKAFKMIHLPLEASGIKRLAGGQESFKLQLFLPRYKTIIIVLVPGPRGPPIPTWNLDAHFYTY